MGKYGGSPYRSSSTQPYQARFLSSLSNGGKRCSAWVLWRPICIATLMANPWVVQHCTGFLVL